MYFNLCFCPSISLVFTTFDVTQIFNILHSYDPLSSKVSQPRRIAASSLLDRMRLTLGDRVGLRMGQGVRDQSNETVIHFVTTGYLVRLAGSQPDAFKNHTHLIIDEVHERSIDGDLLCLLAKRLLCCHPNLRLILMSATLHTKLYHSYFSTYSPDEPLSVGVRRFPVVIKYMEDIVSEAEKDKAPGTYLKSLRSFSKMTSSVTGKQSV